MDEIDTKIKELAQKGIESKDPQVGWIWRTLSLVVFFALLWWTKRQLAQKEQELAEAKSALQKTKAEAKWQALKAEIGVLEAEAARLALEAFSKITEALENQQRAEGKFAEQKAALDAISNWQDLNKYAGVQP